MKVQRLFAGLAASIGNYTDTERRRNPPGDVALYVQDIVHALVVRLLPQVLPRHMVHEPCHNADTFYHMPNTSLEKRCNFQFRGDFGRSLLRVLVPHGELVQ